ncbi:aminotransferase class IV [Marinitoga aeolica]|uniref:Aminotransferase class IV n=1 Tax=Marinitoga aeolica TaxID=2809031 RepID=A0ABY8PT72_9BACT|nr:aminotransferase class IV [Marinitoga aeolica]WGS65817.1 aminotransferase class IV [Marinitoga aeolica]
MIYFNGKYYNDEIPYSLNEGLMYGMGVFETLKVNNGKLEFFNYHYERLINGCKVLDINFNIVIEKLYNISMEVIRKNNIINGSLKINVLKNRETFDIIVTSNNRVYLEKVKDKGYNVVFAKNRKFSKNPLNYIKSNNYAINILELNRAMNISKNEAIFLNEKDEITEGSISNIYFVKNNEIYTPKLECGLLNGVIRRILIEEFNVKEAIIRDEDIKYYDYAFLSNSLMRIMPIKMFEDIKYDFNLKFLKNLEKEIENINFI